MLCEDSEQGPAGQSPNNLNQLDSALYELGMLSAITNSRNQYLQEMRRKSFGSKPNTVKISNLDFSQQNGVRFPNPYSGRNKKRFLKRLMPYVVPERSRTKSENSDSVESYELTIPRVTWMDHSADSISILTSINDSTLKKATKCSLKKSKSLEDIRVENINASQPSHEMEFVSSRIQKLKVTE